MSLPHGKRFSGRAEAAHDGGLNKPNIHFKNPSGSGVTCWLYKIIVCNSPVATTESGWVSGRKDNNLSGSPSYSSLYGVHESGQSPRISCTTAGTTTLTSSGGFLTLGVGDRIVGTNITDSPITTIASIESDTSLTMNQVASGSGTQTLTFFPKSKAQIAATTSGAAADGPTVFLRGCVAAGMMDQIDLSAHPIKLPAATGYVVNGLQGVGNTTQVTFQWVEVPA